MTIETGTKLFQWLNNGCKDLPVTDFIAKKWQRTPWMLDVSTGSRGSECFDKIIDWCYENLGDEWQYASVTIHGATWVGFATKELMEQFKLMWAGKIISE